MAKGDCWSRKARRRRRADREMKDVDGGEEAEGEGEEKEPALVFKISVKHDPRTIGEVGKTVVTVRWLQGRDSVLFESFCGWLKRKVAEVE